MASYDALSGPTNKDVDLPEWSHDEQKVCRGFAPGVLEDLAAAAKARTQPPHVPTMLSGSHWAWHPLPGYLSQVSYDHTVNIGVLGTPGSGKSSLVNALRQKCPRDEGAAPVGPTKTTLKPVPYFVGSLIHTETPREGEVAKVNSLVRIWDLPGIDTDVTMDDVSRDLGLLYYDAVLVVCGRRVSETDKMLVGELHYLGVPSFVVRMKVDMDVNNEAIDNKTSEHETLRRLRENFSKHDFNFFFMVSARRMDKYDLKRLITQLYATILVRRCFEKNSKDNCPICSQKLFCKDMGPPYTCSSCNASVCSACAAALLGDQSQAPCPACLEIMSSSGGWISCILPSFFSFKMLCLC